MEIPPRVRRRDSPRILRRAFRSWKYLRVCGEESTCSERCQRNVEIPPRVRRRVPNDRHDGGNTSACAEKRGRRGHKYRAPGKYLRVCGEEQYAAKNSRSLREIPPRVRRRVARQGCRACVGGNTSACAEKRRSMHEPQPVPWKYLRVCGEEHDHSIIPPAIMEIPPRVRRRAGGVLSLVALWGNTSACAEKSGHILVR